MNNTLDEIRHKIGVYTEAVFMHSISLGHGKTHQEAADEIMRLFLSEAHRMAEQVIGEDEEPGRIFGPGMPTSQRDLLRKEQRLRLSKITGVKE